MGAKRNEKPVQFHLPAAVKYQLGRLALEHGQSIDRARVILPGPLIGLIVRGLTTLPADEVRRIAEAGARLAAAEDREADSGGAVATEAAPDVVLRAVKPLGQPAAGKDADRARLPRKKSRGR